MALKRGLHGSRLVGKIFEPVPNRNNTIAPITFRRPGLQGTARRAMTGNPVEVYAKVINELTADSTRYVDFVVPAGSLVTDVGMQGIALWTAGTSAAVDVGDYEYTESTGLIGAARDADGFFAAVNVKATDLILGETISLYAAGGKAGAYMAGTNTHWEDLYLTTDRVIRFAFAKAGTGTAGRTLCWVAFAQVAETLDTISS